MNKIIKNEHRDIKTLHNWVNNPRTVTKEGIERLKKQITTLGIYKPLIITDDGTVLGGNMRLKALEQLNIKDVWVVVVDAPTEEKKIEYALSDNDRVGKYEGDLLANMIGNFPKVDWKSFSVDLDNPLIVQDLIDSYNFDPNGEWKDMPEFKQEGIDFYKLLVVRFLIKEHYEKFIKIVDQKLTEKTKSIWFPEQDFDTLARKTVIKKNDKT